MSNEKREKKKGPYPQQVVDTVDLNKRQCTSLAFSQEGDYLAVGCDNGKIYIYDFDSLSRIRKLGGKALKKDQEKLSQNNSVFSEKIPFKSKNVVKKVGSQSMQKISQESNGKNSNQPPIHSVPTGFSSPMSSPLTPTSNGNQQAQFPLQPPQPPTVTSPQNSQNLNPPFSPQNSQSSQSGSQEKSSLLNSIKANKHFNLTDYCLDPAPWTNTMLNGNGNNNYNGVPLRCVFMGHEFNDNEGNEETGGMKESQTKDGIGISKESANPSGNNMKEINFVEEKYFVPQPFENEKEDVNTYNGVVSIGFINGTGCDDLHLASSSSSDQCLLIWDVQRVRILFRRYFHSVCHIIDPHPAYPILLLSFLNSSPLLLLKYFQSCSINVNGQTISQKNENLSFSNLKDNNSNNNNTKDNTNLKDNLKDNPKENNNPKDNTNNANQNNVKDNKDGYSPLFVPLQAYITEHEPQGRASCARFSRDGKTLFIGTDVGSILMFEFVINNSKDGKDQNNNNNNINTNTSMFEFNRSMMKVTHKATMYINNKKSKISNKGKGSQFDRKGVNILSQKGEKKEFNIKIEDIHVSAKGNFVIANTRDMLYIFHVASMYCISSVPASSTMSMMSSVPSNPQQTSILEQFNKFDEMDSMDIESETSMPANNEKFIDLNNNKQNELSSNNNAKNFDNVNFDEENNNFFNEVDNEIYDEEDDMEDDEEEEPAKKKRGPQKKKKVAKKVTKKATKKATKKSAKSAKSAKSTKGSRGAKKTQKPKEKMVLFDRRSVGFSSVPSLSKLYQFNSQQSFSNEEDADSEYLFGSIEGSNRGQLWKLNNGSDNNGGEDDGSVSVEGSSGLLSCLCIFNPAISAMAWHPNLPILITTDNNALVVWEPEIDSGSWHNFAPQFLSLSKNTTYEEREDEFDDINNLEDLKSQVNSLSINMEEKIDLFHRPTPLLPYLTVLNSKPSGFFLGSSLTPNSFLSNYISTSFSSISPSPSPTPSTQTPTSPSLKQN